MFDHLKEDHQVKDSNILDKNCEVVQTFEDDDSESNEDDKETKLDWSQRGKM